jgi:(S)-citramalyl-CoA lyase
MSELFKKQYRTSLFWGALRLDELSSKAEGATDIVCIDLEDAVPLKEKTNARNALANFLKQYSPSPQIQYIVRINSFDSAEGQLDFQMLSSSPGFLSHLLLPKLESVNELVQAGDLLDDKKSHLNLFGIIETAKGLECVSDLAQCHSRLQGFYFGGFDLSTAIGCEMDWEHLLYSRSRVVHAAALGHILIIDSPPPFVDESVDQEKLSTYCYRSKALGMIGMVTKHTSQVETIKKAFTPSAAEIARAQKILDMYEADPHRPIVHEGKLIELPMIKKLKKLL